jgi:hypothetical protein
VELIRSFQTEECGQGLTEFWSAVALLSFAAILVLVAFRDELARVHDAIRRALNPLAG